MDADAPHADADTPSQKPVEETPSDVQQNVDATNVPANTGSRPNVNSKFQLSKMQGMAGKLKSQLSKGQSVQ